MITSTCESCHETMSFADHLAGMTVRCKQCRQGWVRVPTAAGVAAAAPDSGEKGSVMLPDMAVTDQPPPAAHRLASEEGHPPPLDAAVTDQRPAPARAPLPYDAPTAAVCPRCGSTAFTRVKATRPIAPIQERECKDCGERYAAVPAPTSGTVKAAMYATGFLLILGGVLAVVVALGAAQEAQDSAPRFSLTPLYGVIFSFMAGVTLLLMPQRAQDLREKRLQAYQASAPPGAPPPVMIPAPPDAVMMSIWFGVSALVAPLVSTLLTVVVFGPAAVVCGIAALAQGHVKGLIGLALGAAGLAVWGSVLYFLLQG